MKPDTENIKLSVQDTVNELFLERLIPFELTAYKVSADGRGEYVVLFHDSRMPSVRFSLDGRSIFFKELVRAAVLDQVKRTAADPVAYGSVG